MRSAVPGLALLLGTALLVLVPAAPALAHATVTRTSPAHGQEVAQAPTAVVVDFDEPVLLSDAAVPAQVIDARGERVDAGDPVLDASRTRLSIPLAPGLPDGAYIASWRVVSADTHPVGGSISFGVGAPAGSAVLAGAAQTSPAPALTLAAGILKGLVHLGLAVALGLVPAGLVLRPGPEAEARIRRAARAGAVLVIGLSLAQLVVQHAWVLSGSGTPWTATGLLRWAGGPYGRLVGARILLVTAAALVLPRSRPAHLVLGGGAVVAVVLAGHGGAGGPAVLALTSLHAAAAIAWLGGLAVLVALLPRRSTGSVPWAAWSAYAGIAVAVLGATGIVQAALQVEHPAALVATSYGLILLAKLALVAAALALAAVSLARTRRRGGRERGYGDGDPAIALRTRREAGLVAGAMLVSGVLSSITPARDDWAPRAEAATDAGPYRLRLEVAPARPGPQTLRLTTLPPRDNFPQPRELRVRLHSADAGVEDLPVDLVYRIPAPREPGSPTATVFTSAAVAVPRAGRWTATVTVVVGDLEQYTADLAYDVR